MSTSQWKISTSALAVILCCIITFLLTITGVLSKTIFLDGAFFTSIEPLHDNFNNIHVDLTNIDLLDIGTKYLTLTSLLTTFVGLTLGYILYYTCYKQFERVRSLAEIGYVKESGLSIKDTANLVRRMRQIGDIPPVYPNGWFAVVESWGLKIGESKSFALLGKQIAVFRDEKGNVHALDAYCPHMGANLGVGGRVHGDCIECPFHGWRFRGADGKCTHIPYADKIPEKAGTKAWHVMEVNGHIYLWHDAEDSEPWWTPPELTNITSGKWTYRGRSEHYVNAHIQEIPENGADLAHLNQLHYAGVMSGAHIGQMHTALWNKIQSSEWGAAWTTNTAPNEHIATIKIAHHLKLLGKSIPYTDVHVTVNQIGPGIVYLNIEGCLLLHHVVPVEPMIQRVTHALYTHWMLPPIISNAVLYTEALQFERDIMIWNNKRFIQRPLLVKSKEDEQISKFRRWYSQFYSKNSPKFKFQQDNTDW